MPYLFSFPHLTMNIFLPCRFLLSSPSQFCLLLHVSSDIEACLTVTRTALTYQPVHILHRQSCVTAWGGLRAYQPVSIYKDVQVIYISFLHTQSCPPKSPAQRLLEFKKAALNSSGAHTHHFFAKHQMYSCGLQSFSRHSICHFEHVSHRRFCVTA